MISVLDPKREVGLWHSVLTVSVIKVLDDYYCNFFTKLKLIDESE